MLWTVFVVSSDFVASGFQSARRRRPDPLTPDSGVGGSGHKPVERTTNCELKIR